MSYIIIAKWFGFVSMILSLGILFNQEDAKTMAKNMVNSETGYIMGGVLPVIFGSFTLMHHHAFEYNWHLPITLISIMMLAMGVYRCFWVNHWRVLMNKNIDKIPALFSLFGIIFGLLMLYIGFVSHFVSYEVALLDL